MQPCQAGITGAEIVQRNAATEPPQHFDRLPDLFEIMRKGRFGNFKVNTCCVEAAVFDDADQ